MVFLNASVFGNNSGFSVDIERSSNDSVSQVFLSAVLLHIGFWRLIIYQEYYKILYLVMQ